MRKPFIRCLVFPLIFFAFLGCAGTNLIIPGHVHNNTYISREAGFIIKAPDSWHPTLTPPSPVIEQKINAQIIRKRELGYIVKIGGTAFIIIETYWLTWGGRPITPIDITWDKNGPEKLKEVCEKFLSMEQEKSKDKFSSFSFECSELFTHDMCLFHKPCLESTKKMVSKRPGENIFIEKIYILGRHYNRESMKNLPADEHGWRVRFTLFTPPIDYQQNMIAFEEVIGSMLKFWDVR